MKRFHQRLSLTAVATALFAAGLVTPSIAQGTAENALLQRVDKLASELAAVRAELDQLRREQAAAATAAAARPAPAPVATAPSTEESAIARAARSTVFSSYGEIVYERPRDARNAQADLQRFVIGMQHRFDDKTKMVAEVEWEHAIASAGDQGEVEIEQAYVERQISPNWAMRAGLFLIPLGLINENHEPTAFYGVKRNFVETAIIPSTWREGGVQVIGDVGNGLTVQLGATTGFDLNKWDATSTEGRESPLAAIHQEMQLARARDPSFFAAANWRGLPGLTLGGGIFSGGASHGAALASSRVTIWDIHARWTPGPWDISALYARGTISNTAALNLPLVGNPTLIPAAFDGAYVQAAYRLWSRGDMSVAPFTRWERFNTAKRFAALPAGLTPADADSEQVWTLGANWQITPGVVLKADMQRFKSNRDLDRVNLGLGWSF